MEMMDPGVMLLSSSATSSGQEMCSFDPVGIPAKTLSKIT
jgi:hypothetical protein